MGSLREMALFPTEAQFNDKTDEMEDHGEWKISAFPIFIPFLIRFNDPNNSSASIGLVRKYSMPKERMSSRIRASPVMKMIS